MLAGKQEQSLEINVYFMSGLFGDTTATDEKNEITTPNQDNNKIISNNESKKTKSKKEPKTKILEEEIIENPNKREIKIIDTFNKFCERILGQFKNNNLHHAIMLSGNLGIGKATCAYWIIAQMITQGCNNEQEKQAHMQLLTENQHPDVFILSANQQTEINVEDIRKLITRISLKSTYGNKFVLIDDINSINTNGLNALLKTLEEPPENTFFFIINNQTSKILDTIYSRCRLEKLSITRNECIKILQDYHYDLTYDEICSYADMSDNSIGIANILIDCNILKYKDTSINTLKHSLNEIYSLLDKYEICKLTNNVKLSILDRIMMNFITKIYKKQIEENSYDVNSIKSIVPQVNQFTKQLTDIKMFDLPVKFV